MARIIGTMAGLGLGLLGSAAANAQDVGSAPDTAVASNVAVSALAVTQPEPTTQADDGWDVAFTPYLWVAGTKGDIAIPRSQGGGVEIDKSFADVLGNLNFAFMGALDVHKDRFVVLGDVIYLSVTAKAEGIKEPGFFEGKVDASTFVATTAVGYRVVDRGPMFVDLFVGGRLVALDVDLKLEGPLQTRRAGASPSHVSPLFGARTRIPLGEKWGLALYGDVGGIHNTDVKWQLVGTVQRDLGEHWRLAAGYRHLQIHHDKNDMEFDVSMSGPILGVTYKF